MTKLEELKALMGHSSPGPFHLIDDNAAYDLRPLWEVSNDAYISGDEEAVGPFNATLHTGCREDFELFIAMHKSLPALIAIAEAAQKVVRHETGSFDLLTDAVREIEK